MTPLEMIAEWEKGCSCAGPAHDAIFHPKNPTSPTECEPCTQGLIDALKKALQPPKVTVQIIAEAPPRTNTVFLAGGWRCRNCGARQ